MRTRPQKSAGQATGTWADLIDAFPVEAARNSCDAVQQLFVEKKVLSKRLAGRKTMSGNHRP
jgi:hypothetical protein